LAGTSEIKFEFALSRSRKRQEAYNRIERKKKKNKRAKSEIKYTDGEREGKQTREGKSEVEGDSVEKRFMD